MKKTLVLAAALSMTMLSSAAFADGAATFGAKCGMCHSTEAGVKKMAPSVFGIMGTKTALSGDAAWDAASMDAFLAAPDAVAMMQPLADAAARAEIVAYMETLK